MKFMEGLKPYHNSKIFNKYINSNNMNKFKKNNKNLNKDLTIINKINLRHSKINFKVVFLRTKRDNNGKIINKTSSNFHNSLKIRINNLTMPKDYKNHWSQ